MIINLDSNKQVQEVIFWRKIKKINHTPLTFTKRTLSQIHLKNIMVWFLIPN